MGRAGRLTQEQLDVILANEAELENTRTEPTHRSYTSLSLMQRVIQTSSYNSRSVQPTLKEGQTLAEIRRSDPLGLFQRQDYAPVGYSTLDNSAPDETGFKTVCRSSSSFVGGCASCMCRTAAEDIAANKINKIYGKDSFIVFCVQGEIWGSVEEDKIPTKREGSTLSAGQSMLKGNIFLGSLAYIRANFLTATATVFHQEFVGIPFGCQWLRVGFSIKGLYHLASYFEDGDGKYVNFFVQKHSAEGIYQVASPTVEIQGTTENGLVSLSTGKKDSDTSLWWMILGLLQLPPLWQKGKTYVHKHRRAELKLVGSTIQIRGGDLIEDGYIKKLKKEQKSLLAKSGKRYFKFMARRDVSKLEKIKQELEHSGDACSKFSMLGEPNQNVLKLEVPDRNYKRFGIAYLTLHETYLVLGGSKKGPDLIVDSENKKIRLFTGPQGSYLQLIEVDEKAISIKSLKYIMGADPDREVDIWKRTFTVESEVCINDHEIVICQQSNGKNPVKIHLSDKIFSIEAAQHITLMSKVIDFSAKEIQFKASQVKANGVVVI